MRYDEWQWDILWGKRMQVHRTRVHCHVLFSIPKLAFTSQPWFSHCFSTNHKLNLIHSHHHLNPPILLSQCSITHYFTLPKSPLSPHSSLRFLPPETAPAVLRLPEIRPPVTWGTSLSNLHPLVVILKHIRLLASAIGFANWHLVLLLPIRSLRFMKQASGSKSNNELGVFSEVRNLIIMHSSTSSGFS